MLWLEASLRLKKYSGEGQEAAISHYLVALLRIETL